MRAREKLLETMVQDICLLPSSLRLPVLTGATRLERTVVFKCHARGT
jgi:hypothetical protein